MKSLILFLLTLWCVKNESAAQDRIIDSLRSRLTPSKEDTATARIMNDISYYYRNKHPDTGLAYGKRALQLTEKLNWKPGMAKSYTCMGNNYFFLSDPANALQSYQKAQEIYEQIHDVSGTAWSVNYIGSVYLYLMSDYPKALEYHERALRLFEQLNDKKGIATNLDNLGVAYENMGDYTKTLKYFQQAASINEQIDNKEGIATISAHMGIFYNDLSEYPKALEYCKKSLSLFKSERNDVGVASALVSLGNIYTDISNFREALTCFQSAIDMYDQIGQRLGVAKCLGNMGLVYATELNYPEAMKCYQKSFISNKELGNKSGMASTLSNMVYVYLYAPDSLMNKMGYRGGKRYSIALETINQSLKLSKEIGELYIQQYALNFLSAVYAKQNKFDKAYETYKDYLVIHDSILNDEKQKQITHKEIEFEYDKKEEALKASQEKKDVLAMAEIKRQTLIRNYTIGGVVVVGLFSFLMIVSFNKRRKSIFDKRVSEVEMKALHLQMNPHFIFNCMHSINKYIIDNEKQLASAYLIRFSKLTRLVLENSREKEVSLEKDLSALELYMQLEALRFKNKFQYTINIDPAIDTEITLIPPMLLQPFVENSILHGIQNKEGGLIKISITREQNMLRCIVEDNGTGRKEPAILIPAEEIKRESLGMKITQERLQIINKLKKVKTAIFMVDLQDIDKAMSGLRIELLLPFETAF